VAFRDVIDITVQAGKGGDGGLSFFRLKYVPKGGPDGGHGANGGDIYLEAIEDSSMLNRLLPLHVYRSETGGQGEGRNRAGKRGSDVVLHVPVGTIAVDRDTGETIADLVAVGQRVLVARGGSGGRGNASFATSTRRAPRFAEYGTQGEKRNLRLELRLIADVGLVGLPNAGKSSLLAALSNAKPEIASYPFTTLAPNLGVIERNLERFTMADIPGIIEDAHLGKGLGLEFLRHIARTRLLVFVLDISEDPVGTLKLLRGELAEYDPELLELPALIALNKTDLAANDEVAAEVAELAGFGLPVLPVSALEHAGLTELRDVLFALLPPRPQLESVERGPVVVRAERPQVRRDESGEGWIITASELEEVVNRFDPSNPEAVSYLHHHFRAMGVGKMLKRAGAKTGDTVQVGNAYFDYFDETAPQVQEEAAAADEDTFAGAEAVFDEEPASADPADDLEA
jgi:GTP-binding protein